MRITCVSIVCASLLLPISGVARANSGDFVIYGGIQDDGTSRPQVLKRKHGRGQQAVLTYGQLPKSERFSKQIVPFDRNLPPGSILVQTAQRRLYFVLADGKAILYPVGVGREGFQWSGRNRITRKAEWPTWTPPPAMIKREAKKGRVLPASMPGGTDNPLGARALYIGSTEYRIHGTTSPWSIGTASSSGCIRMLNEHVIDLYGRVGIGATVVVE